MKKYIVLYHAPISFLKGMENSTPEEGKKEMESWMAWAKMCGKNLVDMGTPLVGGTKLSNKSSNPSKRNVVGYSILQAENMKAAKKLLKNHPHLKWKNGCEIEVHEAMPMKM